MTAPDWSTWTPERPAECPPDVWEKAVASARAYMADPDAPRGPMSVEEALWQGRADGLARGIRVPPRLHGRMTVLHRPYVLPPIEQDPAA